MARELLHWMDFYCCVPVRLVAPWHCRGVRRRLLSMSALIPRGSASSGTGGFLMTFLAFIWLVKVEMWVFDYQKSSVRPLGSLPRKSPPITLETRASTGFFRVRQLLPRAGSQPICTKQSGNRFSHLSSDIALLHQPVNNHLIGLGCGGIGWVVAGPKALGRCF